MSVDDTPLRSSRAGAGSARTDSRENLARASVRRGFVDIAEGQVHYRTAGQPGPNSRTCVMFHASPGSSAMLVRHLEQLGRNRQCFALDTLGNGDSAAPTDVSRSIGPYADAHLRAINALGIDKFDIYGSHTGAAIACEIAIMAPHRVGRMILDGVSVYSEAETRDMLANYAPGVELEDNGSHLNWIWNFVRDTYLFWPWYKKTADARRDIGLPPVEVLHDKVVEVIKAARTYHLPYQAAIAYPKTERLPLVKVPVLLTCAEDDMLKKYFDNAAVLLSGAQLRLTPGMADERKAEETIAIMEEWLDRS